VDDWRSILEGARVGSEGSPCAEAHVTQLAVLRSLQLLSAADPASASAHNDPASASAHNGVVDAWPALPERVHSAHMGAALLAPRPSFLLRTPHRLRERPPHPFRTDWTRLVHPSVLTGPVSSVSTRA